MRKRKRVIFTILFLLICVIGLGYAFLSTNLTINGIANVSASSWDVYFDNATVSTGSATTTNPSIGSDKVSVTFSTTLENPGDYYEFTIDIVNDGTIDAMIGDLDLDGLDIDEEKYLEYNVTYSDGLSINEKDLLSSGKIETIKVRIGFKKDLDASDLPSSGAKIEKEIKINYVQNDGGIKVNHPKMELVDEDNDGVVDTGEILTVGSERFYVISNDGEYVKALAASNLLSGKQDFSAAGWNVYNSTFIGTTAFSTASYWTGVYDETIDLNNDLNIIYPYLSEYKDYLNNNGGKVTDISLITKAELVSLGCDSSTFTCSGAPTWVCFTSYWTSSSNYSNNIWNVYSNCNFFSSAYSYSDDFGIRPVITMKLSNIVI